MKTKLNDVMDVINDVPDYQAFLTVDELKASTRELASAYPDVVTVLPVGHSRQGNPIEAIKIGNGPKNALLFAMPHPNEPWFPLAMSRLNVLTYRTGMVYYRWLAVEKTINFAEMLYQPTRHLFISGRASAFWPTWS